MSVGRFLSTPLLVYLIVASFGCSGSPTGPSSSTLKVASIAPLMGSTTGGTQVVVTGTGFGPDSSLSVGGVMASRVAVQDATTITATLAPRLVEGKADVVVTSNGKVASLQSGFTLYAPSVGNLAPVIVGIAILGPRPNQPPTFANLGEQLTLRPTVANIDSSSVEYLWTGPGTLVTNSGSTTWQVPAQVPLTPTKVVSTLVVKETFVENAITHIQSSAPYELGLDLHDSQKEVLDMGEDFLTLFTRQLSPDNVLHNFSPSCDGGRGRREEADDVDKNRAGFVQDFSAFRMSRRAPFSINFKGTCQTGGKPPQPNIDACSSFSVHWEGVDKSTNLRFVTNGIDYVSAVFEQNRWRLCHSTFVGTETYPALGITREIVR